MLLSLKTARRGAVASALLLAGVPAAAQQSDPGFFMPPGQQNQQRPGQQAQQPQRPQGQQGQRPPQRPGALPPGQPPPTAVIGIVDVPEIQRVSTAFNQVREEIEKRRAKLNDDLQKEQNGWREAQQQLANQRSTLSPDQLRERERGLQDRITDSQRIFRERSRAIEQAAQQALMEIEQALANVIRQVAASRQVNLVLPRPLVIFNDAPFDLTEEVAQQFNRTLRNVTLPPEGAPPAPEAPAAQQRPAAPAAPAAQQGQRR